MSNPLNGTRPVFVKTVSVLTSVATMLSLSGAAYLAPLTAVAAVPSDYGLTEGNTISASGTNDPDVYIVNSVGYKRLFLNPVIFSFYGHLGGFANVKSVSAAARDAFPTSGLFRNCETNAQQVWAVEVNAEDTGVLHKVTMSGDAAVAQDANFFKKVFCINNNEFNWYPKSTVDYTSLSQVPVYSRTGTPTPTPTAGLSASLASDNPAAGTLIETQALGDIAHFQVGGSGLVTSVQLKRLGISGDSTLEDVFLFVNGVRVSDSGNVSSGMITFNNAAGFFTAPATLVVKADIGASTSGQTVGVQLTGLNGQTFAVSANLFTIAATPTLAGLTVGAATGPGNIDPQNDVSVWRSTVTITNEDVYVKRLTIREIGSIDSADVTNLRLLIDGVQVSSDNALDADGYATFIMNTRVLTGAREFKILADVVGGSTRTMSFSLRGSYDLEVMDEAYNVNVESSSTFPITASASTIGGGSVTVVKATNSPSGNVVDDATDVAVARFELKAFGEAVKIETLAVRASVSDSNIAGLTNGRLMIGGTQYGNTTTISTTASTSFTVNYTLAAGATVVLEIRADMKESASGTDVSANDIISMLLDGGDINNAYGVVSANQVDVPTTTLESNNVTVAAATATLSKQTSYSAQVITPPQTGFKIGSWVLTGSSAEAINLTTFSFDINETDGTSFNYLDLTNMWVKYGVTSSTPKSTATAADNEYSISRQLGINETLVIELYADIGSSITSTEAMTADLSVTGTGASSGVAVSNLDVNGQKIDTGTGTFTSSVDAGAAKLSLSNTTVNAGQWRFRGDNENMTVSELAFKVASGSEGAVTSLVVKQNGVAIAGYSSGLGLSLVGDDYVAKFTGLSIPTGLNNEVLLTVDVVTADVNTNAATGKNVAVILDYAKYKNSSGVESTDGSATVSSSDLSGANIFVHDGIPTLAKTGTAVSTTVAPGVQSFAEFSVTPIGNLGIKRVRFDITKSATLSFASASFKIYEGNNDISSVASISQVNTAGNSTGVTVIVEFNSERTLSAATTYRLEGNLSTFAQSTNVTTTINVDAATATPTTYDLVPPTSTFTWTDRSASSHSVTSSDWMNSFLLQALPLSWSKSIGA